MYMTITDLYLLFSNVDASFVCHSRTRTDTQAVRSYGEKMLN